ncbi:hypothetical protein [Bacillus pseudomycoides]|uniref:hypothetical protein n=1 Tax=Bacillus pseudomycoides TaxID=64104 RepID=UPI0020D2724E|nr:hypothetical protein [Bacillus pseudomycoides]
MKIDENKKREKRKDEHVQLALLSESIASHSHFDQLYFIHQSLPNIGIKDVNLRVTLPNLVLKSPLYINAMTGGSERTRKKK